LITHRRKTHLNGGDDEQTTNSQYRFLNKATFDCLLDYALEELEKIWDSPEVCKQLEAAKIDKDSLLGIRDSVEKAVRTDFNDRPLNWLGHLIPAVIHYRIRCHIKKLGPRDHVRTCLKLIKDLWYNRFMDPASHKKGNLNPFRLVPPTLTTH
jgi:hypothetical protein